MLQTFAEQFKRQAGSAVVLDKVKGGNMNFFKRLFGGGKTENQSVTNIQDKNEGCIKCGNRDFEHDSYQNEYCCKNCGWTSSDKPKGNVTIEKIKAETNRRTTDIKKQKDANIKYNKDKEFVSVTVKTDGDGFRQGHLDNKELKVDLPLDTPVSIMLNQLAKGIGVITDWDRGYTLYKGNVFIASAGQQNTLRDAEIIIEDGDIIRFIS